MKMLIHWLEPPFWNLAIPTYGLCYREPTLFKFHVFVFMSSRPVLLCHMLPMCIWTNSILHKRSSLLPICQLKLPIAIIYCRRLCHGNTTLVTRCLEPECVYHCYFCELNSCVSLHCNSCVLQKSLKIWHTNSWQIGRSEDPYERCC